jgi:hypothetical protein
MPLVSITRLRLRSAWYLLPFIVHAQRSSKQMVHHSKFIKGKTLLDKKLTFWTMSLWNNMADMRAYTNTSAHKNAMPKLQQWCDEASVVHWEQAENELPDWQTAYQKLITEGRISKVKYPSPAHANMHIPAPRYPSKTERILVPHSDSLKN